MNYEQRIEITRQAIKHFLMRYDAPRKEQDVIKEVFEGICQAVNSRIRADLKQDAFSDRLAEIFKAVADKHDKNGWPLQSEFVKAIGQSAKTEPGTRTTTSLDLDQISAQRIKAGEAVSDFYITGSGREILLSKKMITEKDLEGYDFTVSNWPKPKHISEAVEEVSWK